MGLSFHPYIKEPIKETTMIMNNNKVLGSIFGQRWQRVRSLQEPDGPEMYMAYDICQILRISNVTYAMRDINEQYKVVLVNRGKQFVSEWAPGRKIHLLTLPGVFQLILHNTTGKCDEIKNYIACGYLPAVKKLVLHRPTEVAGRPQ